MLRKAKLQGLGDRRSAGHHTTLLGRPEASWCRGHSKEIEWNQRPGAPETGAIFHLVTLLSELGKCGLICVGRTREEAEIIFDRVKDA